MSSLHVRGLRSKLYEILMHSAMQHGPAGCHCNEDAISHLWSRDTCLAPQREAVMQLHHTAAPFLLPQEQILPCCKPCLGREGLPEGARLAARASRPCEPAQSGRS